MPPRQKCLIPVAAPCPVSPVEDQGLKVLGIVGWPGSGKTALLVAVLPLLRASGLLVSVIKRTHSDLDVDQSGKDSYRHRLAGAHEVLVTSSRRWALLHESEREEPALPDLLARVELVDLVLLQGFRSHRFPKLEVYREALGKPSLWKHEPEVVAVASDSTPDIGTRILLPLNQPEAIATWIQTRVVTDD
jgi:molybdopterin-guanine dinucleotide biosynthesis adapter protein